MYDRILADVPCSGDGTFRKNVDVWKKWNFAHACNLHSIQARIARRAVELLQPDGVMVYSTCSLNPIENESVVSNLLIRYKGQIELVDARHKLPGMKTLPGLTKWNLMTKTGEIFDTHEQVVNTPWANLMRPHMFPPSEELAKEQNLDRCIRVLPHHQNTGGFFIAVIRKIPTAQPIIPENKILNDEVENPVAEGSESPKQETSESPKEELEETPSAEAPEPDLSRTMKNPPAKRLKHIYDENPFLFIDNNAQLAADWKGIREFFDISDDFPASQMMTRNRRGENIRNIYFVSKQIRDLTVINGDRIKFINMGVPLFCKSDIKDPSNIELRVCQESLDVVLKFFKKRIVEIKNKQDLIVILSSSMPFLTDLSEDMQAKINAQCHGLVGSMIFTWNVQSTDDLCISFTAWIGKKSVRPLVNVQARRHYLTICGIEEDFINDACEKIKSEDQANSKKSLATNPHHLAKHPIKTDEDVPMATEEPKTELSPQDE